MAETEAKATGGDEAGTVLITGASGFLGSALVDVFLERTRDALQA